jgi:transcriptional regulator with XRE-family HTH domain
VTVDIATIALRNSEGGFMESVLGRRLKEARLHAGLSQEAVGVRIGIDEEAAAPRISRYESGDRVPSPELVELLAEVLGVPAPYLYAREPATARLLLAFGRLRSKDRTRVVELAESLAPDR